ncbi:hypothetical protein MCEMIH15_02631 [Caulobacteraceae bacterium]
MRKYFKALDVVAPQHRIDVGKFIKLFDKIFEAELRARHGVHHHARFEDVAINRLFFAEVVATRREMQSMKLEQYPFAEGHIPGWYELGWTCPEKVESDLGFM